MTGRKQRHLHAPDSLFLAEWQDDFLTFSWEPRLHQTRGSFRDDDFTMRRDVIAMGVRNKSEIFGLPGIEPETLLRQKNTALVSDIDHNGILACRCVRSTAMATVFRWFSCLFPQGELAFG